MRTGDAVAEGIKSTAGVVTSGAVVMVAVFSIFAILSEITFKQLGGGLAAAELIDATIVRGVLLPSTMKLLGEWNWYLRGRLATGEADGALSPSATRHSGTGSATARAYGRGEADLGRNERLLAGALRR